MLPAAIDAVQGGRVAVLDVHLAGSGGKFVRDGGVGTVGERDLRGKVGEVGERERTEVNGVDGGYGKDEQGADGAPMGAGESSG